MHNVMVAGVGKIGSLIACLLADSGDYRVHLADLEFTGTDVTRLLQNRPMIKTVALDVKDQSSVQDYLKANDIIAVISSLPYYLNTHVALAAKVANTHYFDLTEDIAVTDAVKTIAAQAQKAFVPQCGLAPGFISIVAHSLMKEFNPCLHAKLRVGALPQRVNNALKYSLSWSTEGLINQYSNLCQGIEMEKRVTLKPLEGLESIQIDGCEYEAFNTSGGLGGLADLYEGKIQSLNYKTIRYPGHCQQMRLLMHDLKLEEDRGLLKKILERSIPKTYQDVVIVYVAATGIIKEELIEKSYVKKIYPTVICGLEWSAIQVSTASEICVIVDLVLEKENHYRGFISQERFSLAELLANRFGQCYV